MIYRKVKALIFCIIWLLNYYKNKIDVLFRQKSFYKRNSLPMKIYTIYPYLLIQIFKLVLKIIDFQLLVIFCVLHYIQIKIQIVLSPPFTTHKFIPRTKTYSKSTICLKNKWLAHLIYKNHSYVIFVNYKLPYSSLVTTRCITELFLSPLNSKMSPASAVFLN